MSLFIPDYILNHVTDITPELLEKMNVQGLLIDIDNTLATHGGLDPAEGIHEWIKSMKSLGIPMLLLSNNREKRVTAFAGKLGLPYISNGKKPFMSGYRKASVLLDIPVHQLAMVGDQLFTDIWGAKRVGMKTILTEPIDISENFFIKLKRIAENRIKRQYYNKYTKNG